MYFDPYYFILVIPAMLIALWAQIKVKSTFARYNNVRLTSGMTGEQAARFILDANGLHNVQIRQISGELTDNFDPRTNVISLSTSVYSQSTPAAVGVAAHETGHAVQYAVGYAPIKIRSAILPITNIGSTLSWPMIFLGLIFSYGPLVTAGIILFSFVTLFQLATLPVEFNASRRAELALENSGMITTNEAQGVHSVLSAAALTYVAALIVSIANLLRLVLLFGGRDKD
ncbi:MAG: zinc metallopeptidase [Oscillospiraceae bacterium]